MRISDWSSDVCSYDLVRKAAEVLVTTGRPVYLRRSSLMWLREVEAKDWAERPSTVWRFTDEGMRENLRDELSSLPSCWRAKRSASIAVPPLACANIGAASWRERGRQSVYISCAAAH